MAEGYNVASHWEAGHVVDTPPANNPGDGRPAGGTCCSMLQNMLQHVTGGENRKTRISVYPVVKTRFSGAGWGEQNHQKGHFHKKACFFENGISEKTAFFATPWKTEKTAFSEKRENGGKHSFCRKDKNGENGVFCQKGEKPKNRKNGIFWKTAFLGKIGKTAKRAKRRKWKNGKNGHFREKAKMAKKGVFSEKWAFSEKRVFFRKSENGRFWGWQ